ncbi:hypothetical protein ACFO1B_31800 [Dactylosporangium siamense]|uniref:SWIM-type domain-containing protein n=1 Tax=Dactylosporangium siamense TaxID=685454 RepID=A0A919UEI1_9ACTN|nr:hypothetical protein [Dactylosporangium siamense]GIG48655.1 hypothetical protein Dsi01nite_066960 [Dactylosporangium siamense]
MSDTRWSHQFIAMLESLRMGTTFSVGRRYARAGNVRSLTISSSVVTALVLDEDGETYRSRIGTKAFTAADWARIERALSQEARYAAKLLAGQLPQDLDRMLESYGLSLFPQSLADLVMDCDCPGWQKPCRHLTAACYVLAEEFDNDPFQILAWRGKGRDELLEQLRGHRVSALSHVGDKEAPQQHTPSAGFWTAGPRLPKPAEPLPGTERRSDAILDQLDHLGLTAGRFEVGDLLRDVYRTLGCGDAERDGTVESNRG